MALTGEQTRLRAVEPADGVTAYPWVNDRDVTEHLDLRYPIALSAEREWAEGASGSQGYRHVAFAIERADDGRFIGSCSLSGQTPEDRVAELGVLIGDRASWGQGLGFDALRTLLCFGFREMNLRRIWLRVDENHPRGIPLYERLGFTHDGRLRGAHWSRGRALDFLVMGIQRAEFDQRYGAFEEVGDVPRG
jgi:RimJ/RimL family protein N-acetyltransferase